MKGEFLSFNNMFSVNFTLSISQYLFLAYPIFVFICNFISLLQPLPYSFQPICNFYFHTILN